MAEDLSTATKKTKAEKPVDPENGPPEGRTPVEIRAKANLVGVEWVKFGDHDATEIEEISSICLAVKSPPGNGKVPVSVKTEHHGPKIVGYFTYHEKK